MHFPIAAQQIPLYLLHKANFESDVYPWQSNLSNHAKSKQNISIYILRPIAKSKFEVGI